MLESDAERREWSLLSSHGQVLIAISRAPGLTVRRLSQQLNFSERRIMGVLRDLENGGLISRERRGRQNVYTVNLDAGLRAPLLRAFTVGDLLRGLGLDQGAGQYAGLSVSATPAAANSA